MTLGYVGSKAFPLGGEEEEVKEREEGWASKGCRCRIGRLCGLGGSNF